MKETLRTGRMRRRRRMQAVMLAGLVASAGVLVAVEVAGAAPATTGGLTVPSGYPSDKAAALQREIDEATAQKPVPKPNISDLMASAAAADAALSHVSSRTAGIQSDGRKQAPFYSGEFAVSNAYLAPVGNGRWYVVYAGSKIDDNGVGQAAIRAYTDDGQGGSIVLLGTFLAPIKGASLTLTAGDGALLTGKIDGSVTVTFDLGSLTYK